MKAITRVSLIVVLAGVVLGGIACSSNKKSPSTAATKTGARATGTASSATQGDLTATLVEYAIHIPTASSKAGDVTFNVKNSGSTEHELVVLKTDLAATDLPTKADGSVNEDAPEVTNVGETSDMASGDTKPLTVDLQPGHYVLICNIVQTVNGQTVSHYQKGMTTEFSVAP